MNIELNELISEIDETIFRFENDVTIVKSNPNITDSDFKKLREDIFNVIKKHNDNQPKVETIEVWENYVVAYYSTEKQGELLFCNVFASNDKQAIEIFKQIRVQTNIISIEFAQRFTDWEADQNTSSFVYGMRKIMDFTKGINYKLID